MPRVLLRLLNPSSPRHPPQAKEMLLMAEEACGSKNPRGSLPLGQLRRFVGSHQTSLEPGNQRPPFASKTPKTP